jgi:small subunit ribosomal protein S8
MINDPLGDMLTRIRNAQMRRRGNVTTPGSKLRARVLEVLKSEGYIRDYSQTEFGNGRTEFSIELKYYDGQPVIRSIERVSKPGRRVYARKDRLPRVLGGMGTAILSTSNGLITSRTAAERGVGGEVICFVW